MPKDEFDFEDPLELTGQVLLTREDTSGEMAECFIEEFLRLGYSATQVLALFLDPFYLGPHGVLQRRGEAFVRDRIAAVFARWGRPGAVDPVRLNPAGGGDRAVADGGQPERI